MQLLTLSMFRLIYSEPDLKPSVSDQEAEQYTRDLNSALSKMGFKTSLHRGQDIADKLELAIHCDLDQYSNILFIEVQFLDRVHHISWDRWGFMFDKSSVFETHEHDQASGEEIFNILQQLSTYNTIVI